MPITYNKFSAIADSLKPQISAIVSKTVFDIQANAQDSAPVDTGFLKASITADMQDDLNGSVTVGAEYGIYVEFGTVHMPAQPFFTPAVDAGNAAFQAAMQAVADNLGVW